MFRRTALSAAVLAFVLGVTGCATNPSNQDMGKFFGAITGAGIGSLIGGGHGNTLATVIGGIAGYAIGGKIGQDMDRADQERAARLAYRGFEQPAPGEYHDSWRSQNSGAQVQSDVSTQPYYYNHGQKCRQFTQETTIRIQGQPQSAAKNGVACFERSNEYPQGMWVIQA